MLLNSASDELRDAFSLCRKLHSIAVKPVWVAGLLLAWCAGQAMGGSPNGIGAATSAQFQLVSGTRVGFDAAETIEAAYKQFQP